MLFQMFCFPIGIGLFAAMRHEKTKFPVPPGKVWRWLLFGAILALLANLLTMHLGIAPEQTRSDAIASFGFLLPAIAVQLTNAAVWEEPLFRGFLWGYLRRLSWANGLIWFFQAGLFTLGHVYYLPTETFLPWLIRMLLPALILGFIAWQAQSIFASMVTHGVFNASFDLLAHTRSLAEAQALCWCAIAILLVLLVGMFTLEWLRGSRLSLKG
jgi:branched-subunit amino acid transport protein